MNAGRDEIFVDQPQRFVKENANDKSYVCRWKKSLHGLKQPDRIQFNPSKIHPCFVLRERNVHNNFVASWVDDLVYCSDDIRF